MALARDVVFAYLRDLGIHYIFGLPGTNEIPIIDGANVPTNEVTYIPCLHENIALGAAMGYARMTGLPGVVVLHVTPGVGHSLGNLFNAHKSHMPLVVLCGQQHSELTLQEPLLYSDTVRVARQYTKWAYEIHSADEFPVALQRAFKVALAPPTGPVFLSIPWDFLLQPVAHAGEGRVTRVAPRFTGDPGGIAAAADLLVRAQSPVIVGGDGVGYAGAWPEMARLASLLGAPVYTEGLSSMMNYPNDLPHWQGELPGLQEDMQARFKGHDVAFLCGFNAQAQLVVYDYALGPLIPDRVRQVYLHNDPWEIGKNHYGEVGLLGDIKATLGPLCDAVSAHGARDAQAADRRNGELLDLALMRTARFAAWVEQAAQPREALAPQRPSGSVPGALVARTLADLQAEMPAPLVYVHEALSDAAFFQKFLKFTDPVAYYSVEGGSLGYSMPASLGIQLAVGRSRIVVNAVGDGSALFYPHTWWTATKFRLPVLYLVLNNREYKTLLIGLQQIEQLYRWSPSGPPSYLYLHEPEVSFVRIAASFGVDGQVVDRPERLRDALRAGLAAVAEGRPYLVEVLTDPALPAPTAVQERGAEPRLDVFYAAREGLL